MINVGIRQYGIDDALPDVFSQKTFGEIKLFMTDKEYDEFKNYYIGINYAYTNPLRVIDKKEFEAYKKKYTKLNEGEEVYLLKRNVEYFKNDFTEEEIDALREKLKIPAIVYAAFNEMLAISSVGFLSDNSFLSVLFAYFNGLNPKDNPDGFNEYKENQKGWTLSEYFDELKAMSERQNPDGEGVIYGNSERGLFMQIVSGAVNGKFSPKAGEIKKEDVVKALVDEFGIDENEASSFADTVLSAFSRIAPEITDYILELGNIDYKKFEYGRAGVDTRLLQINYIVQNGIFMLLYTVGSIAAAAVIIALSARVAANVARDLRRDVFSKVQTFSNAEFDKFSTASLITRTSNDVSQLQSLFFLMIKNTFYAIFVVGGGLYYLHKTLGINERLLLLIAAMIAVISVGVAAVYALVLPKFLAGQKLLDKLNLVTRERLSGVLVIRANDNEPREEGRYEDVNQKITNVNLFINRTMALLNPFMMLFLNALGVVIIYLTVDRNYLIDGSILPGSLLAFLQYTVQIIYAFMLIAGMFVFLPRAVVAMKRIWEILAAKPEVADPENPVDIYTGEPVNAGTELNTELKTNGGKSLNFETELNKDKDKSSNTELETNGGKSAAKEKRFDIRFQNVAFKYAGSGEYALKDVSFEAKSGKTTAIVGVTGSGKTTIVNLILRFYDPTEGAVFVNGIDIRRVRQEDLRKNIGFVSQQPRLFSGTVRENLAAGKEDADIADMDRAVLIAKAEDFIGAKEPKTAERSEIIQNEKEKGRNNVEIIPNGEKTVPNENGTDKYGAFVSRAGKNMSGGQKQRLAIARAVVRRPRLYVFDDSFSALDYLTEANLRAALSRETKENNAGVIVVTQRIASVLNADKIVMVDGGKIIGQGTHKELMRDCPPYGELARSQLPEEELLPLKNETDEFKKTLKNETDEFKKRLKNETDEFKKRLKNETSEFKKTLKNETDEFKKTLKKRNGRIQKNA
jgi:ATP-binding cassette subfamily B protein